jgi:hypothetical protein
MRKVAVEFGVGTRAADRARNAIVRSALRETVSRAASPRVISVLSAVCIAGRFFRGRDLQAGPREARVASAIPREARGKHEGKNPAGGDDHSLHGH